MIEKAEDIKLNVQPVYFGMRHLCVYEGPCRSGAGDQLTTEFDDIRNAAGWEEFKEDMDKRLPKELFNVMKPLKCIRTDDWEIKETWWDEMKATTAEADIYLFHPNIGTDGMVLEFMERFNKPCTIEPETVYPCSGPALCAAVRARNKNYDFDAFLTWEDLITHLKAIRARKVIGSFRLLCAPRLNSQVSMSSVDTFSDQQYITEKLGVQFRFVNLHELLDQMRPAPEGGNATTPGRVSWNLTEEDMEKAEKMADEFIAGASSCEVEREYLLTSLYAYLTIVKTMDRLDCNGFTMPCPDSCSTRRLDERSFTPCFIHTILQRDGIPSACEYDAATAVTEQALIAMTGKRPYNGNVFSIFRYEGKWPRAMGVAEKDIPKLEENEGNLFSIHHSVPHNRMKNPFADEPYVLRHFTQDRGFGPVMRYDFGKDEGQEITLCRIAPDGNTMFLAKATIVCNDGYEKDSCNGGFVFRVADRDDFYKKQKMAGNHLSCVYGDYIEDMKKLAEALDMEAVVA